MSGLKTMRCKYVNCERKELVDHKCLAVTCGHHVQMLAQNRARNIEAKGGDIATAHLTGKCEGCGSGIPCRRKYCADCERRRNHQRYLIRRAGEALRNPVKTHDVALGREQTAKGACGLGGRAGGFPASA